MSISISLACYLTNQFFPLLTSEIPQKPVLSDVNCPKEESHPENNWIFLDVSVSDRSLKCKFDLIYFSVTLHDYYIFSVFFSFYDFISLCFLPRIGAMATEALWCWQWVHCRPCSSWFVHGQRSLYSKALGVCEPCLVWIIQDILNFSQIGHFTAEDKLSFGAENHWSR